VKEFTRDLFTYRDQAAESARLATQHLIRLLQDEETDPAAAMADAIEWRAYARWWISMTDHIERDSIDPVTALANARTSAHDTLLDLPTPRHECPYANAQAIAAIEATRRFFRDTASLHLAPSLSETASASAPDPAHGPDSAPAADTPGTDSRTGSG
jgi:hypothetical protein